LKKKEVSDVKSLKWQQIPQLSDYSVHPEAEFWKNFPRCDLPKRAETNINVSRLEKKVLEYKHKMTCHQFERSLKAIEYLKNGAPAFQEKKTARMLREKCSKHVKIRQRDHRQHCYMGERGI
jgi:hypothetical protein